MVCAGGACCIRGVELRIYYRVCGLLGLGWDIFNGRSSCQIYYRVCGLLGLGWDISG